MNKKILSLKWFFLGLGSEVQIIASLSFSEAAIYCVAPFIVFSQIQQMKKDGVFFFFLLSIALVVGAAVACFVNETPSIYVLRGMAVTILMPCVIVVAYYLLTRNPAGFKWYLLGAAISMTLCTFVFHKSVEVATMVGDSSMNYASELIMEGPMFWVGRTFPFLTLWTKGWYLHSPMIWDVLVMLFIVGLSMLSTTSGRSTALGSIVFLAFIIIGGKTKAKMMRVSRWFFLLLALGVIGVFLVASLYRYTAIHGFLGEDAAKKYERQTGGDKGLRQLILGGRMEAFCGLLACVDRPIVGFGPWAIDDKGYLNEFLSKYAKHEDYVSYLKRLEYYRRNGVNVLSLIPCHSHITQFWCWYGLFGLLFWLYIVFVIVRYVKKDCWVVPQWYAWLACSSGIVLWKILFSPFSDRIGIPLFVVACLIARSIRRGKRIVPHEMVV